MNNTLEAQARIALSRFGLGRAADEALPGDARGWLLAQCSPRPVPAAIAALPTSSQLLTEFSRTREAAAGAANASAKQDLQAAQRRQGYTRYRDSVNARVISALQTDAPFQERLVHFWANHFCVSADNVSSVPLVGSLEHEAIRPHVMGRFEDMLMAVEHHPAMLFYLDQIASVGPDSRFAAAARARNATRERGLNENLAREILELHTLGVRSGYTQEDVTEFARALTGWSLEGEHAARGWYTGGFAFRDNMHQPGARTILGRRYEQQGEAQAHAVLHDLARAPATANFIASKLARHFAGDTPPSALVDRLARAFTESEGDLPTVYRALINSPEPWQEAGVKFKTPWEWMLSAMRGFGMDANPQSVARMQMPQLFEQLAQPVWKPGSPAGWPDTTAAWAAPEAIVRRVEEANRLAGQASEGLEPRRLMSDLLGSVASPVTRSVIEGADSRNNALALLLVSPEFMRR
ncbi:DUF1800 domain-containing protein [Uliginosibacterium sp. H3]|uniref:DUF1800 domain-containing protein n=1 Tax=Uliginosibacterium silvisoli TaxID=3114758 RepID=A0ABU6K4Q4_9RHOO|nr:DUF1800 domain-containing protein [Uliginosibacterium sp. H3]